MKYLLLLLFLLIAGIDLLGMVSAKQITLAGVGVFAVCALAFVVTSWSVGREWEAW